MQNLKKAIVALAALCLCAGAAFGQNSTLPPIAYPNAVGNYSSPGSVSSFLDGNGKAVPASTTNPIPSSVPDGKAVGPASLTSTGTLFTISDTSGYGSISVQVTSAGIGSTIAYEASEDGTNWVGVFGWSPNSQGTSGGVTSSTTAGILWFPTTARQFRARVSAYAAGTVTVQATLRKDPLPKQSMQVAFLQALNANNVGGYDKFVTNTPTVQAAAYAAGNAIGGLQTLSYFRGNGGGGILNNISLWSKGGATTPITLYIFQTNPNTSTCTDKVAFSLGANDYAKMVAGGPIVMTPSSQVGTTASNASFQQPISVQNQESSTSLYVCAVVGGSGFTPASTSDLVFNFGGLQD
jgi:hypothetical protein